MNGNSYYYRKLHSLLGVIPMGFFLIEHLLSNYTAFKGGPVEFLKTVEWLNSLPLVLLLEIFFIWLPILYHGVYGLYVAYQARYNTNNYSYFRNWMFVLQRTTGVLTLIFITWHFYETRFQVAVGHVQRQDLGVVMHNIATNPVLLTIYIIGIVAAVFHFCNGMWSFLVSWGITVGPRAQRISTYVWMIAFILIAYIGVASIVAFVDPQFATVPQLATSH
ncbi:MAG: succinate dehydrogenase [Paenibacillus sp. RIFOXYA1_FULL_44_5]|nr:MAG: succinate dehydrogenase [Paenibacillus sp. RIFOXYA1_FULL_44_5]